MYLIALCDDEKAELDKTEKLLRGYEKNHFGLDLVIDCFENADELLCRIEEERYMPDLIFMDIYMPGRRRTKFPLENVIAPENNSSFGIDAAGELRGMGYKGKLAFLTTSREHALEAFNVDASQYLVKPVSEEKLFSVLDKFLKDVEEERRKYILLRIDGRLVRVSLNDIVYCEAQGKTQCLHLANGTQYLLHMTMMELYGQLAHYQEFVKIGVAYIVNLGYVGSLNAKEIHMDNGKKIYLPRGAYKGVREQYFNYYCRELE